MSAPVRRRPDLARETGHPEQFMARCAVEDLSCFDCVTSFSLSPAFLCAHSVHLRKPRTPGMIFTMKSHLSFFVSLVLAVTAHHLRADIAFAGVITDSQGTRVALTDSSTQATRWVKVGDDFNGYQVAAYDAATETLRLLGKDGAELLLKPKPEKIQPPPTAPEPVEYVIKAGDSGAKIARAHQLTLPELIALNPGVNWNKLSVGQKIRVQ